MNGDSAAVPVGLVGCDFRRGSSRWRSALVMSRTERSELLSELVREGVVESLVVLDTCNRNEWIFAAANPSWAAEVLRAQMLKRWKGLDAPLPSPYVLVGEDAVRHVLRVAGGLESFVVGERQITTQLNQALERTRKEKSSSVHLNGLGATAARVARDIHGTCCPTGDIHGVHELAVCHLGKKIAPPARVLVIGMGEIGRRVLGSLQHAGYKATAMNRTRRTSALPLSDLPGVETDAIIACTAARTPVVTPDVLPRGPLVLLDLGIPSQIAPACAAREGVTRLELDDLLAGGDASSSGNGASQAEAVVEAGVREFVHFCQRRRFVSLLDRTRKNHEDFVEKVLPELLDQIVPSADERARGKVEYRLRGLFRRYTNSIFQSINDSLQAEP